MKRVIFKHKKGLFQPSQNQMDSLISEMREAKALQEQSAKAQQERELKRILIEAIDDYLDWRKITRPQRVTSINQDGFHGCAIIQVLGKIALLD